MITGFSTKRIKSGKTLGERLKVARCRGKISLAEAETGTKVRAKYLEAIENGDWEILPQEVYVRGFVLSYVKFLNLNVPAMTELYNSEIIIHSKEEPSKISYNQSVKDKKVLVTPKLIAYSVLTIFVTAMISYIIFQLADFAGNPNLKILHPDNNAIFESDSIDVAGITDGDTIVMVNEEKVPVTSDGHFATNLKLHQGVNVIKFQAVNKIKKETSQIYTLEYKPKTASIENNLEQ